MSHAIALFRLPVVILAFFALISGCSPKAQYTITREQIIARAKTLPGEIYLAQGAPGPYKEGAQAVGAENSNGTLSATTSSVGKQSAVEWPASAGFYYEATSYVNEAGQAFYLVRKIPAKE